MSIFERFITRRAEATAFRRGKTSGPSINTTQAAVFVLVVLFTGTALAILFLALATPISEVGLRALIVPDSVQLVADAAPLAGYRLLWIFQLGCPFLLVVFVAIHLNPFASRITKYFLALFSLAALNTYRSAFFTFYEGPGSNPMFVEPQGPWSQAVVIKSLALEQIALIGPWLFAVMVVWLVKPARLRRAVMTICFRGVAITAPLAIAYGFFVAATPLTGFPLLPVYLLVHYLGLRFVVYHAKAQQPIIYLRSFSIPDVTTAFGRIVVPATSKIGVVSALIHPSQNAMSLQSAVNLSDRARLSISSDDEWQTWVNTQLLHASSAIVDTTISTASVQWELENALEKLGPSHVAVLYQSEEPPDLPKGVWALRYSLAPREARVAQVKLKEWLRCAEKGEYK
jgi:hypothetical protein